MLKYLIPVSMISFFITSILMKKLKQSSQNLFIDFIIFAVIATILTIILYFMSTNFRDLMNKN